jgi:ABC-type sugar transport system permease subunit
MMPPRMNSRRGERGSSLVEFALAFSMLFTIFAGAYEFGYAFFMYNQLDTAVRDGARYSSFRSYDSANCTPSTAFQAAVKNTVLYGDPNGGAKPVIPGLTAANIRLTATCSGGLPTAFTVSIANYRLHTMFLTATLNKPAATFPYVGVYAPL